MDAGKYTSLMPWDVAFWSEKLRLEIHDLDSESLRAYFPLPKVLDGLCVIIDRLYNVKCSKVNDVKVWHGDAECWTRIEDDKVIGEIYLDLYAREGKKTLVLVVGFCHLQGMNQQPIAL